MVLSDFDRTLAHEKDNFVIRADVAEVINEFSKKYFFFVVTGREKRFLDILAKGLNPTGWIIENGGIILLGSKKIILASEEWFSIREELLSVLRKEGIKYSVGEVIVYLNAALDKRKVIDKLYDEMGEKVRIEWNRNDAMILPKNVSKGNAVRQLKIILNFKGKTIGIGDSENDISLFEAVDIKVAVANALPEIKRISDIVLDKEDGEGVKEFLKNIIENKFNF